MREDYVNCPCCDFEEQSITIDKGSVDFEDDMLYVEWVCENCGSTMRDYYSVNFETREIVEGELKR